MSNAKTTALAFLLAAFPYLACAQSSPGPKLGVVNTERVLRDAAPAKDAQKRLEVEFAPRDQALARLADQIKRLQGELDGGSGALNEDQRRTKERAFADLNRDFQRKQAEFKDDLNQRRNDELARLTERANQIVQQIAAQENFDIIFHDALYANPRIDITDKVLKALQAPPAKGR